MAKGCVPLPGVNNPDHAHEVVGALDWDLDLAELEELSQQARRLHTRRRELQWLRQL